MKAFLTLALLLVLAFTKSAVAAEGPNIQARAAVLMDANTGIILYERQMHEILYPASITKVMTALLTLESGYDGSERVHFSREAVYTLPWGAAHIAMNYGETLTMDEALYAIMLPSANDVSIALAEFVAGSNSNFSELMTRRARELGAYNTNFTNPHGLHHEEHFTTAYDTAVIMRHAVQNPRFVEIISTAQYQIPPTELQSDPRPLHNTNRMIQPTSNFFHPDVVGGKTGFTSQAMHTLVTYAKRGDISLIAVVLYNQRHVPYTDTEALIEYGFSIFQDLDIFNAESYIGSVMVTQPDDHPASPLPLYAREDISMLLPRFAAEQITVYEEFPQNLRAPIQAGQAVGSLLLKFDGLPLATVDVFAQSDIALIAPPIADEQTFLSRFRVMAAISAATLLLFLFIIRLIAVKHRRTLRQRARKQQQMTYRYKNFSK